MVGTYAFPPLGLYLILDGILSCGVHDACLNAVIGIGCLFQLNKVFSSHLLHHNMTIEARLIHFHRICFYHTSSQIPEDEILAEVTGSLSQTIHELSVHTGIKGTNLSFSETW